jgi:hypothetical protein
MSATETIIVIAVALLVVLVVAAMALFRRRRRARLQEHFGPEWDRAVDSTGSQHGAETALLERLDHRQELHIHALSAASRDRYQQQWRQIQGQFVDQPSSSLLEADHLVTEAMEESGYPMQSFDERADMLSVDHPEVVEHYRSAHRVFVRDQRTPASTEDVRRAFVSYRALFSELLDTGAEPSPHTTDTYSHEV